MGEIRRRKNIVLWAGFFALSLFINVMSRTTGEIQHAVDHQLCELSKNEVEKKDSCWHTLSRMNFFKDKLNNCII
jgi:hypothetical protein